MMKREGFAVRSVQALPSSEDLRMRLSRDLPLAGLLGLALVGCGPNPNDRPTQPVVATVTIAVPNMT